MMGIYRAFKEYVNKIIRFSKFKVYVLWFALKSPHTPKFIKFFGFIVLVYVLSPIDLIPDFIPILGYLDELVLVTMMVSLCLYFIPVDVMDESIGMAKDLIQKQQRLPKQTLGIFLILMIWVGVIWYIASQTNALEYFNK
ncbi:YkvA family protein [Polynucleobacter kasalickyi]|uniref:DUF1232 domain-containing protein n=1 Tax=Polynucleobacter kasalickyi TaxID=1938817 RepID=A0A1W1YZU5_9BURK|nr:DUF1232 domain-containing protein [Polynucleobacter kasalickyi]SMC41710.1 Protein of unknown function [Polynucleobacter kasalickyi]